MALLADTVAGSGGQLGWVEDVTSRRSAKVGIDGTVTAITGDRLSGKGRTLVPVEGSCNGKRLSRMAEKTLGGRGSSEVRITISLISRSYIPDLLFRIPGDRRLKQKVAHPYEITEGVIA
jgi:hypothetical protein